MSDQVIALRCSSCGYSLDGLNTDIIFFCRNCGRAWVLEEGLTPVRILITSPVSSMDLYLPFWKIDARVLISERISRPSETRSIVSSSTLRIEKGLDITSFPEKNDNFIFPAFSSSRILSLGVSLYENPPSLLKRVDGINPPLYGGTVSIQDAHNLAEAVAVGVEIAMDDSLASLEISVKPFAEELIAIPCSIIRNGVSISDGKAFIGYDSFIDSRAIFAKLDLNPEERVTD